jgi:hypothetical protein
MRVRTDVKSDNRVVIRAGAPALGRIIEVEKASYNHPECVVLEAVLVKAVDGQQISLLGNKQSFCGQLNNESMEVSPFRVIIATIINNAVIGEAKTDTTAFLWDAPAIIKPPGQSGHLLTLAAGNSVMLEFQGPLDFAKLTGGDVISFTVAQPVIVNGKTTIAAGALATGLITNVSREKDGYVSVTLEARQAYAVDGQQILLRSTPQLIKRKVDAENSSPYQSFKFRSFVQTDVKIRI